MSEKQKKTDLVIIPVKIKTKGLMINESSIPLQDTPIRIDFNHDLSLLENGNILLFELEVLYYLPHDDKPDEKVLGCLVENYFDIPNLQEFRNDDGLLMLPTSSFITIVSLSISHSRAIVATHCLGTIFEKTLIPVVDPIAITKAFIESKKEEKGYPINFKEAEVLKKEDKIQFEKNDDLAPTGNAVKSIEEQLRESREKIKKFEKLSQKLHGEITEGSEKK